MDTHVVVGTRTPWDAQGETFDFKAKDKHQVSVMR